MDLEEAGQEWKSALMQSKLAAVEARLVRQGITHMLVQAAEGHGPPPTFQQLAEAARLEQVAEDRRLIEEALLNRVFGVSR